VPANPRGSERIDKQLALRALEQRLAEELEAATAAHRQTTQGATHEESRAENDKDTRALEATYLARGQAKRVAELSDGLARLASITSRLTPEHAPVRLGALVEIEHDLGTLWYLLADRGGVLHAPGALGINERSARGTLVIQLGEFVAQSSCCSGNANKVTPGNVDFDDVTAVLANWNASYGPSSGLGDATCDGVVNFDDLTVVLSRWNAICP
jgi:hypothetical protein